MQSHEQENALLSFHPSVIDMSDLPTMILAILCNERHAIAPLLALCVYIFPAFVHDLP